MIKPAKADDQLAEKQQAVNCGGLGMIMELVKQVGLRKEINRAVPIFKWYAPYDETDHVLNIALNLLTGAPAWSISSSAATMKPISMR